MEPPAGEMGFHVFESRSPIVKSNARHGSKPQTGFIILSEIPVQVHANTLRGNVARIEKQNAVAAIGDTHKKCLSFGPVAERGYRDVEALGQDMREGKLPM